MKNANHRRIQRFVWTTAVCAALIVAAVSVSTAIYWRKAAYSRADGELRTILSNLSRNILSSSELSNAIVTAVDRTIEANEGTVDQMRVVSTNIAAVSSVTARIGEILFAESGGWVLASSRGPAGINRNVKREAFFRQALAESSKRFLVTRTAGPSSDIAFSRRTDMADGTAMGVVAAIVPRSYFHQIWSSLDAGRGLEIRLGNEDGDELVHYGPNLVAEGVAGIGRQHQVERLPLIVQATWPEATILEEWNARLPFHILVTLFVASLVFVVAHLVSQLLLRGHGEELRLADLAQTDALTGLGNRRALIDVLRSAGRQTPVFSVLLIDLDRFKSINDTHGHLAGDAVLIHVARALRAALPADGHIARLGGDEFAAVLGGSDADALAALARELSIRIGQPVAWSGTQLQVGCSIGIATYPDHGRDPDALLQAADLALYQAKSGKGGFRMFEPHLRDQDLGKRRMEEDLKVAIERGEIHPFYQPVVCLKRGRITAFEILARWNHPTRGLLPPGEFIGMAEERKLITPLTIALLRQAVSEASSWPADIRLALNISPQQLREPLLAHSIFEIVRHAGFDPSRLEIELTEDAILDDYELAKSVMAAFRLFGATIALDDFGTGYSSLAHLRELRFDKLKIDRSFVRSLPDDRGSANLVETILHLAESFELHVTAEGVETEAQASFLRQLGCTYGQGYLFGKPLDADASRRLLEPGAGLAKGAASA